MRTSFFNNSWYCHQGVVKKSRFRPTCSKYCFIGVYHQWFTQPGDGYLVSQVTPPAPLSVPLLESKNMIKRLLYSGLFTLREAASFIFWHYYLCYTTACRFGSSLMQQNCVLWVVVIWYTTLWFRHELCMFISTEIFDTPDQCGW